MKWHRGFPLDYLPFQQKAYLCTDNDEIVGEIRKKDGYWRKIGFDEMKYHQYNRSFVRGEYLTLEGCKKQYEEDYDFHVLKNGK